MIEHMNIIDALSDQISALLELMQCANDSADISSIRVASEMCLTMHDELMGEVDKISKEIKEQEKSKVIEILKQELIILKMRFSLRIWLTDLIKI